MIVTFYSFKGGVGRTLALANVGVVLAQRGHRVLVIDFDLEAPGLTRYLENVLGGDLQHRRGLLELLEHQRDTGDAADLLQEYTVEVLRGPEGGLLDLLASGYQDASYPKRVLDFDWAEFFRHDGGGDFFEFCRAKWVKQYDFVLITVERGLLIPAEFAPFSSQISSFLSLRQVDKASTASLTLYDGHRRVASCSPTTELQQQ
jgi:cellulose biosynthesis protein BcsQ